MAGAPQTAGGVVMPCYDVKCLNGHVRMVYYHSPDDRRLTPEICPECNNTQGFIVSLPGRYTYFSESTPRVIENLGHEPVTIRSHAEHIRIMKERQVEWAPQRRGMPGCWS